MRVAVDGLMGSWRYHIGAQHLELPSQSISEQFTIRRRIPFDKDDLINEIARIPINGCIEALAKVSHVVVVPAHHHRRNRRPRAIAVHAPSQKVSDSSDHKCSAHL